jgi:carboxyl-terminal processing protease
MEKIAKKSTNRIASNSYFNRTKELHKKLDNLINTPKIAELVTIDTALEVNLKSMECGLKLMS